MRLLYCVVHFTHLTHVCVYGSTQFVKHIVLMCCYQNEQASNVNSVHYSMLAEKLNMAPEEAERWIVNLIRNAHLDAKIDSKLVSMRHSWF